MSKITDNQVKLNADLRLDLSSQNFHSLDKPKLIKNKNQRYDKHIDNSS